MGALISDTVNKKLDEIVTFCFVGNRICDRAMSVLDVSLVMPKTAGLLHPKLAHLFPKLADVVSEYQADRNCLTFYGATPADDTMYSDALVFFKKMVEYMEDLESLCYEARDAAMEERDYATLSFVDDFIESLIPVTKQCLLLVDKAEAYDGKWQQFDRAVGDFILLD